MAKCIPPDEIQLVMDLLIPGWVRISGLSCLFRRIGSTANSLRIDIYHTLACTPGPIDKRAVCDTCGSDLANCAGHWGCIRLALPVFHIGFFKTTVQILQMICKTCSRILILEPERSQLLQRVRRPKIVRVSNYRTFARVFVHFAELFPFLLDMVDFGIACSQRYAQEDLDKSEEKFYLPLVRGRPGSR